MGLRLFLFADHGFYRLLGHSFYGDHADQVTGLHISTAYNRYICVCMKEGGRLHRSQVAILL